MSDVWRSQNRGPVVLAVTAAMIAVSTLFVILRLVSRVGIVKRVTADDYLITVAWLLAFGLSFVICYAVHFGLGTHESTIPLAQEATLQKLEYTFSVLYNPTLMATKTSILVFYLSLSKTDKVFKWATIATMLVVNSCGLGLALLNIFQCRPLSVTFDLDRPASAHCTDVITLYLSSAPVNIITDIAILLLPMPVLRSLRLPRKQKIILYVTFGVGIFVAAVDVVRIAYLEQATLARLEEVEADRNVSETTEMTDFAWYASLSFMWSAIEVNVGIMCACVPALKPLVSRFLPSILRDPDDASTQRASVVSLDSAEMARVHRVPSIPMPASPVGRVRGPLGNDEDQITFTDFMNIPSFGGFITTPDMSELPQVQRTQTAMTDTSGHSPTSGRNRNFFDFVNMYQNQCLVRMTNRESFRPIAEVTVLFFVWGFAYGLLNTLNAQFQLIAGMSTSETTGIHSAYFAGYFLGPLTFGRLILKKWGFKSCYIVGLAIYGTGTLIFWPSAVLTSFPAFFISNFIVGLGLSTLEIAADSFIPLCGPPEYAEVRLNLSQGFQAIGSVVSPLLASKVLFRNVLHGPSLIDVQWAYLAISLFTFFLAFVYYLIKIPEATDEELEEAASRTYGRASLESLRRSNVIWYTLGLATLSQFLYVGGQEGVGVSASAYLPRNVNSVNANAVAHALFASSRFLAAGACLLFKPRHLLLFFYAGAIVFAALAMHFSGTTSTAMLMCVYFFEGPIFSLIFATGLRGLGRHTKDGSALLVAAISGGAVIPPIQTAVAQHFGVKYSFCVVVAVYAGGMLLPVYYETVELSKRQIEPMRGERNSDTEAEASGVDAGGSSPEGEGNWPRRRWRQPFGFDGTVDDEVIGDKQEEGVEVRTARVGSSASTAPLSRTVRKLSLLVHGHPMMRTSRSSGIEEVVGGNGGTECERQAEAGAEMVEQRPGSAPGL